MPSASRAEIVVDITTDVISCHVPSMFSTSACTPNLPSVPTSLATRVTSAAKMASWSIMLLMVLTKSRISPDTFTPTTFCVRSPRATAVYIISYADIFRNANTAALVEEGMLTVACAIVRTCSVKLAAMMLTFSVRSFQVPATPGTRA